MRKFKDIKGYEGVYQISEEGYIKSKYGHLTNGWLHSDLGYRKAKLYKDKKHKSYFLHRLVAIAFIPNPENKPCVNHIDSDPRNNNASNLEWCTQSENVQHASRSGRLNDKGVTVLNTATGETFKSIKYAAESIGMKPNTLVYKLSGKRPNNTNLVLSRLI